VLKTLVNYLETKYVDVDILVINVNELEFSFKCHVYMDKVKAIQVDIVKGFWSGTVQHF